MIDTSPPSFGSFSSPAAPVLQSTTSYAFGWSAATDNASGVASYNLQAQVGSVVAGACSAVTWNNLGSVVNQTGITYTLSGMLNSTCYRLLVSPVDRATNAPSSSASAAILVDTHTPNTPSTPILAPGSDTGSSNTDGLTSKFNSLVFTGTAEAGTTVNLYVDGGATSYGSATATGGNYSITTTTALSGVVHTITAKATTAAGVTGSASSSYTVVIHLTCPA
jgi:hypothetical protein